MDKEKTIGILTIILGFYASWRIINLSAAFGVAGINGNFLGQVVIVVCAFIGSTALYKNKKIGYVLALLAWSAELYSGINADVGQGSGSLFISVSAMVSIIVIGVLVYGMVQRLLRNDT